MELNLTKMNEKVPTKIRCETCDYTTSRKSQFDRHNLTAKHLLLTSLTKVPNICGFICEKCEKTYKSRVGLWGHKKKCVIIKILDHEQSHTETSNDNTTTIIVELVKQNNEFHQLLIDQNKLIVDQNQKLIELSAKPTTIINSTVNKNKFSLNFFLNEKCKDAMNITDFVSSLSLKLSDLENTGKHGFIEGISRIFIKGLKDLDIYKRPIHCSDIKRETMYVKDHNIWEKEKDEKTKIHKTIRQIANKNIKQIPIWIEEHPKCEDYYSKVNDQYLHIVSESMGGINDEETNKYYTKIIKNVSKEVIIEEKNYLLQHL